MRLIEMLERDEHSLTRILDGLDQIDADHADGDGGECSICATSPTATSTEGA